MLSQKGTHLRTGEPPLTPFAQRVQLSLALGRWIVSQCLCERIKTLVI